MIGSGQETNRNEPTFPLEYGVQVMADPNLRMVEIRDLSKLVSSFSQLVEDLDGIPLSPGVTVVVPSFRGRNHLGRCVRSLMNQDLNPQSFETVVVINGEDDGSSNLLRSLRAEFPRHRVRILFQSKAGAGNARNTGIAAANFDHITFVDDDDYVGPSFLSSMLNVVKYNQVGISPIINVSADGRFDENNPLNLTVRTRAGDSFDLLTAGSLVGFNACKLFPTRSILNLRYSSDLQSGEDICFMAEAAVANRFQAKVGSTNFESAYFRTLRDNSISRKEPDFDFAVIQRIAVMEELESHRLWDSGIADQLISGLIESQAGFIRRYLDLNNHRRIDVVNAIASSAVKLFPWYLINRDSAKDLVISYCFAPYADTSATVAAKAIVERGKIVDVVYNNMSSVRKKDPSLETIAGDFVDQSIEIDAVSSFGNWSGISEFVSKGITVVEIENSRKGGYNSLYSRVLWPGSHFLAALFKIRNRKVVWTAEFSDPLSHDANGDLRKGSVVHDSLLKEYRRAIRSAGYSAPKSDSLFTWCEYLAYVFADEIIFTNENQFEYMLKNVSDLKLERLIRGKSRVRAHPTPPSRSYDVIRSGYELSSEKLNIGYFGGFYENRGLNDVLTGLMNSTVEVRNRVRLHVFTNNSAALESFVDAHGLRDVVKVQDYVPYLEFLNLTTKLDVLLVNDVERSVNLDINPFLPSKYSDYLGSGKPIWGIVDDGSPLSQRELRYRSAVGDSAKAVSVIDEIHTDWVLLRQ